MARIAERAAPAQTIARGAAVTERTEVPAARAQPPARAAQAPVQALAAAAIAWAEALERDRTQAPARTTLLAVQAILNP